MSNPSNGRLDWKRRHLEIEGIKYTIRSVERLGYTLVGTLTEKGGRGIDLVFSGKEGLAVAEAKGGMQTLSSLKVYRDLRQGSMYYILSRVQRYRGANQALAKAVENALMTGRLRSFVGISSKKALYEIDINIARRRFKIKHPNVLTRIE